MKRLLPALLLPLLLGTAVADEPAPASTSGPAGGAPASGAPASGAPASGAPADGAAGGEETQGGALEDGEQGGLPPEAVPAATLPGRDEFRGDALSRDPTSALPTQDTLGRGIRLRPWLVFRPALRLSAVYSDNVLRSDGDEQDDVELTTSLTLSLEGRRRRTSFSLGYTVLQRTFPDTSELDAFDQVLSARGTLELKPATVALSATVGRLTRPEDPALQGGEARRWSSQAGLNVQARLTRFLGLLVEGSLTHLDYEDRRVGRDQLNYGSNLFFTYPFGVGTLQLGGGYRELKYLGAERTNPDLGVVNASLGYVLQWRSLSGSVRVGYERSRILERRQFPRDRDPPDGLVASVALSWRVRRSTSLQLTGSRQIDLGTTGAAGAQTTSRVSLALVEQLTRTVRLVLTATGELQEPELNEDLTSYLGSALLEWSPKAWLVVTGQVSYQKVERDDAEEYDVFRLGISLTFRL